MLPGVVSSARSDAIILTAIIIAAWWFIARTELCTRFFQYVTAHPESELDSLILAGIFSAIGLVIFAFRRWAEAAKAERIANDLAYHDALTGLPNRRAFMEALETATAAGVDSPFACLLFDFHNFKQVNDLHGHFVGDLLLKFVAVRLSDRLSSNTVIARLGGDEFALLFSPAEPEYVISIARFVVECVSEPLLIEGLSIQAGISAGMARFPDDAVLADALLRKADIALYKAKTRGPKEIQAFEPEMEDKARRSAAIAEALRDAIPRGEIVPHYQPIIALATGEISSVEVLSRWKSPVLGVVAPDEFIPVAIESGLIGSLTWQVFKQACTEAAQWPIALRISFNLAPRLLSDQLLPLQLLAILSSSGLATSRLNIELTEDALLENAKLALANEATLKAYGITLTLDDFGSGYSSLHHLQILPFDKVKIDRSYINKIVDCERSRRMVEGIITFIHSLGIPVVAEGVETADQARLLKTLGCDFAQGWLYGKAVANVDFLGRISAPVSDHAGCR